MKLLKHIVDSAKGKHPITKRRSPLWPRVEKSHLAQFPKCAVCGSTKRVQVHHKKPFHLYPDKELDPDNLITLCEPIKRSLKCHLIFGHIGDFHLFNPEVGTDAVYWQQKITEAHKERSC